MRKKMSNAKKAAQQELNSQIESAKKRGLEVSSKNVNTAEKDVPTAEIEEEVLSSSDDIEETE